MTDLYLIRHGEALGAVLDIIGDTALSPLGILQAECLRDRLAATGEIAADVLISSTFKRARQTAEIIAPALDLPIVFDDEVQELRDGVAEGMHEEEYRAKYGEVNFRETPFRQVAPAGENWGQFVLRASTALDRIIHENEGKTIVIVCHGGVIGVSFAYFLGMGTLQYPQAGFDTDNTSITHWARRSFSGRPARWRLKCYNDDMHLRDIHSTTRIPWKAISGTPAEGAKQPLVPLKDE
ncbi:MAG TPA: histidine phosphatase family protein [Ktedonobacteraceae bacterium]|nr:histidine phosphatase family protein [Ktedonobacteraceae bacterium]